MALRVSSWTSASRMLRGDLGSSYWLCQACHVSATAANSNQMSYQSRIEGITNRARAIGARPGDVVAVIKTMSAPVATAICWPPKPDALKVVSCSREIHHR